MIHALITNMNLEKEGNIAKIIKCEILQLQ
jgi:hypothetical protein